MHAHFSDIKGHLDNGLESWYYHLKTTDSGWEVTVDVEDDQWSRGAAYDPSRSPPSANELIDEVIRLFGDFLDSQPGEKMNTATLGINVEEARRMTSYEARLQDQVNFNLPAIKQAIERQAKEGKTSVEVDVNCGTFKIKGYSPVNIQIRELLYEEGFMVKDGQSGHNSILISWDF